jgi:glycosyltransferase involved in cell wall biosynthesis
MNINVSVILPIYKQVAHVEFLVNEYLKAFETYTEKWEIIFVVNGPDDGSYLKLTEITKDIKEISVFNIDNDGWGRAVKYGISKANGQFICYTNSSRTKVSDLLMILHYAKVNDNNVVKANRFIRDGYSRKIGSLLYNLENRVLLKTLTMDVNATPKVFPARIIKSMNILSDNDLIDAEILARCFKQKIPIIEVPIYFNERISGRSSTNISSALRMYWGLFKLRKKI